VTSDEPLFVDGATATTSDEPARRRFVEWYARLPQWTGPVAVIIFAVLVANAVYVLGLTNSDPISWTTSIAHSVCRLSCGRTSIDPNVGAITQAIGHRAALDLLHGHLPWWNSFEGLGQPLAGEMQAAGLFPFTLLLALPAGLVWMHIIFEVIAGICTYLLLRRLRVPIAFATVGGALFALNGTFAWLSNTVVNPLAFLPMLLLGIEVIFDRASEVRERGWHLAAIALALSLYSGFPEGAYFDALFCAVWALVRLVYLPRDQRLRILRRLGLAGVVGVALAVPALVPFADFLKVAFVGGHTSAVEGTSSLPAMTMPMFFDPYVYGTIFDNAKAGAAWDVIGGYFTISVSVLALVGLIGRRLRALRIFLGVWIVAGMGGAYDVLHSRVIWNLLPFINTSAFSRYIISSCELALVVLAVLGLTDITEHRRATRAYGIAALFMLVVLVTCTLSARPYNHDVPHDEKVHLFLIALGVVPFVSLALLLVLSRLTRFKWAPVVIALVVVGESLVFFMVPTIAAPTTLTIDYAPINYLRAHQGEERYLDLQVLFPNWGSQFGLNSLSAIDLPFPTAFKNFIQRELYPGLQPANEFLVKGAAVDLVNQEYELAMHLTSYEDASVKYLLAPSSLVLSPQLTSLGVREVFRDQRATIYELPHPRAFFTASPGCEVTSTDVNVATLSCATAGTLLRTELSMKGWTAKVNGRSSTITTVNGVYQRVDVPAGASTVTFDFLPPHEDLALSVGLLSGLLLLGTFIFERRTRKWRSWRSVVGARTEVGVASVSQETHGGI
jgi:hypothetical protein